MDGMSEYRKLPKAERQAALAKAYGRAAADQAASRGHDAQTSAKIGRAAQKALAKRQAAK